MKHHRNSNQPLIHTALFAIVRMVPAYQDLTPLSAGFAAWQRQRRT